MLDTDSVSYAIRGEGRVAAQVSRHPASSLCVSALTVAELRFGATRRRSDRLHRSIDTFLRDVAVLPFDEACATVFARIAARSRAFPKHFARIPGLTIANWL